VDYALSFRPISRIAPTPSGLLHLGNIINFYMTWKFVRENDGELWLRIDDCDGSRERAEYVQDIFDTLNFLKIDWDHGPKDSKDFYENFSQQNNTHKYKSFIEKFSEYTFVCECSRKDVQGQYKGTCYSKNLKLIKGKTSLRIKTPSEIQMKDFVLWRKDDLPSYQLVSIIDDLEMKTNLIIRGEDLEASTQAQLFLNNILNEKLNQVKFIHHPLLTDENNLKLSKGSSSYSIKQMREAGMSRESIINKLETFGHLTGK
jgi:glutamyl/glutaminyl-tRNA synthetase